MKNVLMSALLLACICCVSVEAQCVAENEAIQPGEELVYDLKFNWRFIWLNAGEASMTVKSVRYDDKDCLEGRLLCVTNKTIDRYFPMRDTLVTVAGPRMEPLYFRKGAAEGKRYAVEEGWFDYVDGKCHVRQYRHVRGDRREEMDVDFDDCLIDMLGIVLRARSFDASKMTVGMGTEYMMATGRAVKREVLMYEGKKVVGASDNRSYSCHGFTLFDHNEGKNGKKAITVYVTDDKNHIPIRIDLYLRFGAAKAYLRSVRNNRYPITSFISK
ncbi:MAG: DUF3108 domain-containing protein [Bacteroidales bacterium]|nr:DUF3108 domain-containing protein [Bacteroidales bacterium]